MGLFLSICFLRDLSIIAHHLNESGFGNSCYMKINQAAILHIDDHGYSELITLRMKTVSRLYRMVAVKERGKRKSSP